MSFLLSLGLTEEDFTELYNNNGALRSMCDGYAREHHVRNHILKTEGVISVEKMPDSDRTNRYDLKVETIAGTLRVEVKSCMKQNRVQLRASDRRSYTIEDVLFNTHALPRGHFDILCIVENNVPYYILSKDIPENSSRDVPLSYQDLFLSTSFKLQSVPTFTELPV